MDYFDVCIAFMDKDSIRYTFTMEEQKARRLNLKYLKLCCEDERRSDGLGTTWGWVNNDI